MLPLVWDAYGLGQISGIRTHALQLHKSLQEYHHLTAALATAQEVYPDLDRMPLGASLPFMAKASAPLFSYWQAQKGYRNRPIIYHALSNLNLPLLGKRGGDKFVLTIHDLIPMQDSSAVSFAYSLQFPILVRRALAKADRVIAVSEATRDKIGEFFGQKEFDRVEVISNGVDHLWGSQKETKRILPRAGSRPQILFVARGEAYKGFDLLSNIIAEMSDEWDFLICTDGKGMQLLRHYLKNVTYRAKSLLHILNGSLSEIEKAYETSHLLLTPSRFEGFGLPLFEALSYGMPVVCRPLPSYQMVRGYEKIHFVDSSSVADWIDGIRTALDSPVNGALSFPDLVQRFALPTWKDAAKKCYLLYNDL